ncbi:cation diffusion facilitator family transporter [Thalassotalea aquiviva]|uniref:cation diffusion facilitator family transporter n=1 Tax=Thalassotalea aquiviva TaxID=3242415 RepID=UPI00352AD2C2
MKNKTNETKLAGQYTYADLVTLASKSAVAVALVLLLSKLYAWWVSGSGAMLASTTDSLLDVFASLLSFIMIRFSLAPADEKHKFGHGKAENLAALMQSSFVLGSAILLLFHGANRIYDPVEVTHTNVAIGVSLLAIVLTLALVLLQKKVIAKTDSVAITADSLHYQSDLLLNLGVIIALLLNQYQWPQADGLYTVIVGVFLFVGAIKIVIKSLQDLMDRELSEQDRKVIEDIIAKHPQVHGFHQLRTRQAGPTRFIQFHLELDDDLSLFEAHQISDQVEQMLLATFSDTEVFIHQDPISLVTEHRQR